LLWAPNTSIVGETAPAVPVDVGVPAVTCAIAKPANTMIASRTNINFFMKKSPDKSHFSIYFVLLLAETVLPKIRFVPIALTATEEQTYCG
jgi:hypothetical protein